MWEMKLQDMKMWHKTAGMENAREGKWGSKNADVENVGRTLYGKP